MFFFYSFIPLLSFFSFSLLHSLPSDYIYVPAQSTYTVPEGEQREVSFVLDNPPPDGVFEFDYNVVLSTTDGSATGMHMIKAGSRCYNVHWQHCLEKSGYLWNAVKTHGLHMAIA